MILQTHNNLFMLNGLYLEQLRMCYFILDFKLEYCFDLAP